ncbi:MAG TPA: arsenate reductase ArsC [Gammaproteobacteria bacterium]|nr:arsenate reductase ArsC [Gammaproteobacteria bacterium]
MDNKPYNVLFLCTRNSTRSILAEALLNHTAENCGRFKAFSAGSHPKGGVHPLVLELLQKNRIPTTSLRSKSWDEFAVPGAPQMDFVFTVCDQAAREPCPYWPGQPTTAHWGVPDPSAVQGTEAQKHRAFRDALMVLSRRIELFACLPLEKLDKLSLEKQLKTIGISTPGSVA